MSRPYILYCLLAIGFALAGAFKSSTDYVLLGLIFWLWATIADLRSELDHIHRRIDIVADAQNEVQR